MGTEIKAEKKHSWLASLCSILGLVLLLLVVALCLPLTVPRFLGYELYAIVSGSMEPAIPVGSVVYAKEISPQEIEAGDVIVFYGGHASDTVITHRAVENHTDAQELLTKGDANEGNDMLPISYSNVIGRVELSIPLLGFLLPLVTGISGKIYLVGILGAGVLFRILGSRLRQQDEPED